MASNPPLCPFCGAAGDPGDRFCQACGRDLLSPPPPPADLTPPPYPMPPPLPPPARPGPPAWALAVIAAGAVALLATGGWLGYRLLAPGVAPPGREEPAPEPSVPPAMEPASEPAPLEGDATAPDAAGAAGEVGGAEGGERASAAETEPPAPAVQERPARPQDDPAAASRQAAEARRPAPSPAPSPPVEPALKPEPPASAPAVAEPSQAPPAAAQPPDPPPAFSRTYECRETAEFHVDPEEALVTVDGKVIGKADDWDGMAFRKGHRFPGPGAYAVKLSLEGYRTEWVRIVVNPQAKKKTAKVELELEEE